MNKFIGLLAVAIIFSANVALASDFGFNKDNLYVGPTVGLNQYFSGGTLGFGAKGEYGLMDNVNVGSFNGAIGVGAEIFYSSYSQTYYMDYSWKYTYLSFLVFAAYHITPKNAFDPYVRLGIGYDHISYTDNWIGGGNTYTAGYGSGLGFTGDVGFNYRFSNSMSFRAALGWPVLLSAGIDFNLGMMGWQKK